LAADPQRKQLVTSEIAQRVVDRLEVVEVEERQPPAETLLALEIPRRGGVGDGKRRVAMALEHDFWRRPQLYAALGTVALYRKAL